MSDCGSKRESVDIGIRCREARGAHSFSTVSPRSAMMGDKRRKEGEAKDAERHVTGLSNALHGMVQG